MCGFCSGAGGVCEPPTKSNKKSSGEGNLQVLVSFSPVNLKTIKECGSETIDVDDKGYTYTVEKMINVTEKEYPRPKDLCPAFNKIVFINCSDITGSAIYNVCSEETRETEEKEKNLKPGDEPLKTKVRFSSGNNEKTDPKLMGELIFAVRELKDYLFSLKKDFPDGGTVKLYICAIYPVECLLFGLIKVLGITVANDENQKLYESFSDEALKNPVLSKTKDWLNEYHWTIQLEYYGVNQLYIEKVKKLTPKGIDAQNYEKLEKMWAILQQPTEAIQRAYATWKGSCFNKEYNRDQYTKAILAWKNKNGKFVDGKSRKRRRDPNVLISPNRDWEHIDDMLYPALDYNGSLITCLEVDEKLVELDGGITNFADTNWEQQLEEINKQIDEEETKLRILERKDNDKRGKQIKAKIDELDNRMNDKEYTEQRDFWETRYAQDYDYGENMDKDIQLIEFEGELLNKDQLIEKQEEIKRDHKARKRQIEDRIKELKGYAEKVQDIMHDIKWNAIIGGIQLGLATLCIVFAPFAAPFAGLALGLAIGSAVVDIGLEIWKWRKVEDDFTDHLAPIILDVVFCAFGPVFSKVSKWSTLRRMEQQAQAMRQNLQTIEGAASEADAALKGVSNAEGTADFISRQVKEESQTILQESNRLAEESRSLQTQSTSLTTESRALSSQADDLTREAAALRNAETSLKTESKWIENASIVIVEEGAGGAAKEERTAQIFFRSAEGELEAARLMSTASSTNTVKEAAVQLGKEAAPIESQAAQLYSIADGSAQRAAELSAEAAQKAASAKQMSQSVTNASQLVSADNIKRISGISEANEVLSQADQKFQNSLKLFEDNNRLREMRDGSRRFLESMEGPIGNEVGNAKIRFSLTPGLEMLVEDDLRFTATALGYDVTADFIKSFKYLKDPILQATLATEMFAYTVVNTFQHGYNIKNGWSYFKNDFLNYNLIDCKNNDPNKKELEKRLEEIREMRKMMETEYE